MFKTKRSKKKKNENRIKFNFCIYLENCCWYVVLLILLLAPGDITIIQKQ